MASAPTYTLVDSGATLSAPFALRNVERVGIHIPTVTSCQLQMQASPADNVTDVVSATFFPVITSLGSRLAYSIGPGSCFITLDETLVGGVNIARIQLTVAVTVPTTLTLIQKTRL